MEPKNWSLHVEWAFLVATMLGGFYLMHGDTQQQIARSDAIIEQTTARSDAIMEQAIARSEALRQEVNARSEALRQEVNARSDAIMERTTARNDRLYEMFIDLVKEGKCPKQEGVKEKDQIKDIANK